MDNLQKFIEAWKVLLRRWWVIALTCLVVGGLSAWYIFSLPRTYTSTVVMVPELNNSNNASSLGALASMAGVKLGSGGSEDAIYPEFYPKVMGTPEFVCDLLGKTVVPKKQKRAMTLFDYLTKCQEEPWWDKYFPKKENKKEVPLTSKINPQRLTAPQERLVRGLIGSITNTVDKRTDIVTIRVTLQDPEVAAQVATLVQEKLQLYIIDYRTSKARNDVEYIEGITKDALKEYKEAQRVYAAFADSNQDLVLASAQQEEERLENEMQLAFNAYSQSAQQLQMAKAKVQERTPAFTILQAAGVPPRPSGPKRVVFVAIMLVLAFFASIALTLCVHAYRKVMRADKLRKENERSAEEMANDLGLPDEGNAVAVEEEYEYESEHEPADDYHSGRA